MRKRDALWLLVAGVVGGGGCGGGDETTMDAAMEPPREVAMGPVAGHDLPPTDLERVQVGQPAPDFTAASLAGTPITLSQFRGEKNVNLVFYRGHW